MITEFNPDLVFLDVQMPGLNGFEVVKKLDQLPQIIFSTAYDNYALAAFEVHAVDYLLKPYTRARFAGAVQKLSVSGNKGTLNLVESFYEKEYPERIFVEYASKIIGFNSKDIIWIEANRDYCNIHVQEKIFLSSYGIGDLEVKFNPASFIRVHRSAIVNVNFIKEIEKDNNGYIIILANQKQIRVSRTFANNVKRFFV